MEERARELEKRERDLEERQALAAVAAVAQKERDEERRAQEEERKERGEREERRMEEQRREIGEERRRVEGLQEQQRQMQLQHQQQQQPWWHSLPSTACDPISLEPLNELPYPPFQLCSVDPTTATAAATLHYFDGHVLAYYLVSQLQFIDPLNRRALLQSELESLDDYLRQFRLGTANTVEAFRTSEAKKREKGERGEAGSAGSAERAERMQADARSLLVSLFDDRKRERQGGGGGGGRRQVQEQVQRMSVRQLEERRRREDPSVAFREEYEAANGMAGISSQAGMTVIDDDVHPGLRGGNINNTGISPSSYGTSPLPPPPNVLDQAFPTLQSVAPVRTELPLPPPPLPLLPASRGIAAISGAVARTDPAEVARQRAARDAAVLKAQMTRRGGYEGDGRDDVRRDDSDRPDYGAVAEGGRDAAEISGGQIERNQRFASAFGIQPGAQRPNSMNSMAANTGRFYGDGPDGKGNYDHNGGGGENPNRGSGPASSGSGPADFAAELLTPTYSEPLLRWSRDDPGAVLKLERRWCEFIADPAAASCQLKPMLKPERILVHEYSDHWRLHTQSFDPEPRRYLSAVKMKDTRVPQALLSEAGRNWNGRPLSRPAEEEGGQRGEGGKERPGLYGRTYDLAPGGAGGGSLPAGGGGGERKKLNLAPRSKKDDEAMSDPRFEKLFNKGGGGGGGGEGGGEEGRARPAMKLAARSKASEGAVAKEGNKGWAPAGFTEVQSKKGGGGGGGGGGEGGKEEDAGEDSKKKPATSLAPKPWSRAPPAEKVVPAKPKNMFAAAFGDSDGESSDGSGGES